MLRLDDYWVWDSWYADDGEMFHAFYLKAPRSLGDPELRHHRASIGHSISSDLTHWTHLPDAIVAGEQPSADDLSTWTGSVTRDDNGLWHMFYTGIAHEFTHDRQRILHATSTDLVKWRKDAAFVLDPDPQWYESFEVTKHQDWRDPWVFNDSSTQLWHMLITGNAAQGVTDQRGTVAHATSTDLQTWKVQPPLSDATQFRQLEVFETIEVSGQPVIVWCMDARDCHAPVLFSQTGTWTAPADSLLGPFHFDRAEPIKIDGQYAGRIVRDRSGRTMLLAFVDSEPDGTFGGYLCDPIPLAVTPKGTLQPS